MTAAIETEERAPGEFMALAFAKFNEAAGSLERSYSHLQVEVVRLRSELCRANREVEEEREAKRRLQTMATVSAVLAHEIRNPLACLELFAGLLASSELAGEPLQWAHHMQAGTR